MLWPRPERNCRRGSKSRSSCFGVAAARFQLIHGYGAGIPFWDEWSEAGSLFKPFLEGKLSWAHFFARHNEHRIAAPRVLALDLFWVNGRWDPVLECCVNALLSSLGAGFLVWLVYRYVARALLDPAILLALVLFALPLSWYDVLWGFQSVFYLQILFSLVALWGCGLGRAFTGQWWLGLTSALCAIFTNASGFLISISLLLICAARNWKARRWEKENLATILAGAGIFALGYYLQIKRPDLISDAAHPWGLVVALLRNLSWPNLTHLTAALSYLPLFFVAWNYLSHPREREPNEHGAEILLLIGSWALVQFVAIALARGSHGEAPSLRYLDIHLVAIFINSIALIMWLRVERSWAISLPVILLWISAIGAILPLTINNIRFELPRRARESREQLRNVTAYLRTGRLEALLHKARLDIPYQDPAQLAAILDDPVMKNFLPAELQPPLRIVPPETTAFFPNPTSGGPPNEDIWWSSFTENPSGAEGIFRSAPLTARSPYLQLAVAGDLGSHALSLKLIPENGARLISPWLAATNGTAWRTIGLRAPPSGFRLEATDRRAQGWFAFSEPHEIGPLSYLSLCLLEHSSDILWADVEFLLALILLGRISSPRLNPAPDQ